MKLNRCGVPSRHTPCRGEGTSNPLVTQLMALVPALLALACVAGCQPQQDDILYPKSTTGTSNPAPVVAPPPTPEEDAKRVMLVINAASPESRDIGAYYRAKRQIPRENVVIVNVSTSDNVGDAEFVSGIQKPIQDAIKASKNQIDFIVLTSGLPIRLNDGGGNSVDGALSTMNLSLPPIPELKKEGITCSMNPYYKATDHFSSKKYNMYLVTRLIGYTPEDAKRLVDNALAAKPLKGPFFLDKAGNRNDGGYGAMQKLMDDADANLKSKGYDSSLDTSDEYILPPNPLMGYVTWGSNDAGFKADRYKGVKFLPGALCETFVSTSGRTFHPTEGGQSLIADLIANGVTGVKGYVSEPYTFALAQPDILFDRYTDGFNLAESFYAASLVCKWKDIVVGDPLCNPYAK